MSILFQLSIPILKDMLVCWLVVFMAEFTGQCKRHMTNALGDRSNVFFLPMLPSFYVAEN